MLKGTRGRRFATGTRHSRLFSITQLQASNAEFRNQSARKRTKAQTNGRVQQKDEEREAGGELLTLDFFPRSRVSPASIARLAQLLPGSDWLRRPDRCLSQDIRPAQAPTGLSAAYVSRAWRFPRLTRLLRLAGTPRLHGGMKHRAELTKVCGWTSTAVDTSCFQDRLHRRLRAILKGQPYTALRGVIGRGLCWSGACFRAEADCLKSAERRPMTFG